MIFKSNVGEISIVIQSYAVPDVTHLPKTGRFEQIRALSHVLRVCKRGRAETGAISARHGTMTYHDVLGRLVGTMDTPLRHPWLIV